MRPTVIGNARHHALGLERSSQNLLSSPKVAAPPQSRPSEAHSATLPTSNSRIRVCVSAHNQLVRDALCRVLSKRDNIQIVAATPDGLFDTARLAKDPFDVLLLVSRERLEADIASIHSIRAHASELKILLIGPARDDAEFLQYVRAGISGYLLRDASADDVAQAIENVRSGKAVCPGELCAALFRFLENSEPRLHFGSPTQRLGLTRREQQIVPLIAKGFTNKEIANHFCLSEQTVKNHLYRMKHKIGAEDRLSIVQKFRHHGLLL
jgi:DNA-binding NarL/FixJ family response regulator